MKLSQRAWQQTDGIIAAILQHPFNQELMQGTLVPERFSYYVEQDAPFLRVLMETATSTAARLENSEDASVLLRLVDRAHAENSAVQKLCEESWTLPISGKTTIALLAYANYLRSVGSLEPPEVAVAVILGAGWIYSHVARHISQFSKPSNPFSAWIAVHMNPSLVIDIAALRDLFDRLGEKATPELQKAMCDAFYTTAALEWHFWNDAYCFKHYDDVSRLHSIALPEEIADILT